MDTYLQSIRRSALSILDGTRAWDGGLFQVLGEQRILYSAVVNRSLDRSVLIRDVKSTMLSGGSLTAAVFAVLLVILLLVLIIVSAFCRCGRSASNSSKSKLPLSSKLRLPASRVSHLPVTLHRLLGIVSVLVLLLAIVPLMLSFAANSRLHASVSDNQASRDGTVAHQIKQSFDFVEKFLTNLIPAARRDTKPVIQRTLDMTAAMKNKSQAAYQLAFRNAIGANSLMNNSSEMLDRISLYYYTGKWLAPQSQQVIQALNSLSTLSSRLQTFESDCRRYVASGDTCRNLTEATNAAKKLVEQLFIKWNDKPLGALNNVTNLLRDFVGLLDGTNSSPEVQQRLKDEKITLSNEFNKNITRVFDRELNSTAFVLSNLEKKLTELEGMIDNAIVSLRNVSARVLGAYGSSSSRFESMRFGATTVLLVLLLLTLVLLSTETVLVQLPNVAKTRSGVLMGGVYVSYVAYALAIVFVCLMFCLTGYLQTETCRYLYEERTADSYLVPEINAIVRELKARAAADPNATDQIPLRGVGRLLGGILDGCKADQPILKALDAIDLIDTEASNSAEESLQFKLKGRDILRREMSSANLDQLRDTTLGEKLKSLKTVFLRYRSFEFAALGRTVGQEPELLVKAQTGLLVVQELTRYIQLKINNTQDSTWMLAESNQQYIENGLDALSTLINTTNYFVPKMEQLESKKDVVTVIDDMIESNAFADVYLSNQTLWTDTAVQYYTMYVVDGSEIESKAIADNTTVGFLSVLAPCRDVYNFYMTSIGIPCRSLLYPLSILWFCIAWFLWFGILLALLVHLSLAQLVEPSNQQQQRQQQQHLPLDDKYRSSNGDQGEAITAATEDVGATAAPLLTTAAV